MGVNLSSNYSDTNDSVYVSGRITVTTSDTEAKVGASREAERQFVRIYNDGNKTVYFGPGGQSTTDMEPLKKRQYVEIAVADLGVFLKTDSGTSDVIIQEIG